MVRKNRGYSIHPSLGWMLLLTIEKLPYRSHGMIFGSKVISKDSRAFLIQAQIEILLRRRLIEPLS